mmetsp:Transcript_66669/g.139182  ORF Transcript_66669/g.139182 Transcript_66669/m.139182 type:complete len:98 (-) Transcript_66669:1132-1425(-)
MIAHLSAARLTFQYAKSIATSGPSTADDATDNFLRVMPHTVCAAARPAAVCVAACAYVAAAAAAAAGLPAPIAQVSNGAMASGTAATCAASGSLLCR